MTDLRVSELVSAFIETWNAKDIPAFAELFASDADFIDIVGNQARGQDGIAKLHLLPLTTVLKTAQLSAEDVSLRDLGHGLIAGDLRWKNVGAGPPDHPLPDQRGNLFFIAAVEAGEAKFVLARNTNFTGDLNQRG